MSNAVINQTDTLVTEWQTLEINVSLSDMEQLNIMACKGGYYFDSVAKEWKTDTTKTKFRLTGLGYKLKENGIVLSNLRGNFYTKANRVGAREGWVSVIDQETIDQLPKEVLAHATEHFAKVLSVQLQNVINAGVMVKAHA